MTQISADDAEGSTEAQALEPRGVSEGAGAPRRARWERSLAEVTEALRARLRRRFPSLAGEHDDLLHDTLAALAAHMQRAASEGRGPAPWSEPFAAGPLEGTAREELFRLAHAVLRRRVADLFRARARAWAAGMTAPASDETSNEREALDRPRTPEAERRALLVRMLRVCVAAAETLPEEDRELLASAGDERERPLSDRERQRLRRARQRLCAAVREALGDEAAALLRDEG